MRDSPDSPPNLNQMGKEQYISEQKKARDQPGQCREHPLGSVDVDVDAASSSGGEPEGVRERFAHRLETVIREFQLIECNSHVGIARR